MSVTTAPSPWPAPAAPRRDDSWRFCRPLDGHAGWVFDLRRNISIAPRQLLAAYLLLCAVTLTVAGGFWWHGVSMVGLFAGLELLALGAALLLAARHAGDREVLILRAGELAVEQQVGAHVARTAFRASWVRVEPVIEDGSLVELTGEGRRVCIGRHVRSDLRVLLAQELRRALHLARANDVKTENQDQSA